MLPCEAQQPPASLNLTITVLLMRLLRIIQGDGEPVVAYLIAIAFELVLNALNKLGELAVNVDFRVGRRPVARHRIAAHDVFECVAIVELRQRSSGWAHTNRMEV